MGEVRLTKQDHIGIITLDYPPVNALDSPAYFRLYEAMHDLAIDEDVRVVILTGAGERAFVAGADVKEFVKFNSRTGKVFTEKNAGVREYIRHFPKPVICAINGLAYGGGCALALVCDIRIASENAKVNLSEINMGIVGAIPYASAVAFNGTVRKMVYSGESLTARQAIGHPHDHPLDPVGQTQYTQQLRFSLPQKIDDCHRTLGPFREALQALSDALGVPMPRRESEIRRFSAVAEELRAWLAFPRSWGRREEPESYFRGVRALCAHLLSAGEKRDLLLKSWQEEFLRQDGAALAQSWDNATEKWLLPRLMAQNGLARRLAPFAKGKIDAGALREALALLAAYQRELFEAEKLSSTLRA